MYHLYNYIESLVRLKEKGMGFHTSCRNATPTIFLCVFTRNSRACMQPALWCRFLAFTIRILCLCLGLCFLAFFLLLINAICISLWTQMKNKKKTKINRSPVANWSQENNIHTINANEQANKKNNIRERDPMKVSIKLRFRYYIIVCLAHSI